MDGITKEVVLNSYSLIFIKNIALIKYLCYIITMNEYTITLSFDDVAQKWYAQNDEIPIILEDFSLDTLINRVKIAVPEMLIINNLPKTNIYLAFKMEPQAVMV